MVGWGCWPWDGEEADSAACLWRAARSAPASRDTFLQCLSCVRKRHCSCQRARASMGQDETERKSWWDGKSRVLGGSLEQSPSVVWGEAGVGRGCPMEVVRLSWATRSVDAQLTQRQAEAEVFLQSGCKAGKMLQGPCVQGSYHALLALTAPSTYPQLPRPTQEEVVGAGRRGSACVHRHAARPLTLAQAQAPQEVSAGWGCDKTRGVAAGRPASPPVINGWQLGPCLLLYSWRLGLY